MEIQGPRIQPKVNFCPRSLVSGEQRSEQTSSSPQGKVTTFLSRVLASAFSLLRAESGSASVRFSAAAHLRSCASPQPGAAGTAGPGASSPEGPGPIPAGRPWWNPSLCPERSLVSFVAELPRPPRAREAFGFVDKLPRTPLGPGRLSVHRPTQPQTSPQALCRGSRRGCESPLRREHPAGALTSMATQLQVPLRAEAPPDQTGVGTYGTASAPPPGPSPCPVVAGACAVARKRRAAEVAGPGGAEVPRQGAGGSVRRRGGQDRAE